MVKTIYWIQHTQKKNRSGKNNDKEGKVLYKLMNNAISEKTIENLKNTISVQLENNEKDHLKLHQNQATCRTKYLTII